MNERILIVDDEPYLLSALGRTLSDCGFTVDKCVDSRLALEILAEGDYVAIVSDENMPGLSGSELLNSVAKIHPSLVRVMLTGESAQNVAARAVNTGFVDRLFFKPVSAQAIAEGIRSALEHRALVEAASQILGFARRQDALLRELELDAPGITKLEKDSTGAILIDGSSIDSLAMNLESSRRRVGETRSARASKEILTRTQPSKSGPH